MFDARIRPLIDPPLNRIGRMLAHQGVSANHVTIASGVLGILAGIAIARQAFGAGLLFILASRLLDGLDGAVARATKPTDLGGYLDIVADFVFYVAVPVGFGFAAPQSTPYALLLVASFTLTGVSFLAYATIAAKRGIETEAHGRKSFFYSTGIAEGTETIAVFILMCLMPHWFPQIATVYAGLCVLTVTQRTWAAAAMFKDPPQ
jgi:phosphatidylglycerophosphate synthase